MRKIKFIATLLIISSMIHPTGKALNHDSAASHKNNDTNYEITVDDTDNNQSVSEEPSIVDSEKESQTTKQSYDDDLDEPIIDESDMGSTGEYIIGVDDSELVYDREHSVYTVEMPSELQNNTGEANTDNSYSDPESIPPSERPENQYSGEEYLADDAQNDVATNTDSPEIVETESTSDVAE